MKFDTKLWKKIFFLYFYCFSFIISHSIFSLRDVLRKKLACFPSTNWLGASGHGINRERMDARIL